MGIQNNTGTAAPNTEGRRLDEGAPQAGAQATAETGFAGTSFGSGAPRTDNGFLSLKNGLGLQRMNSEVEPYLKKITDLVSDHLNNVQLITLQTVSNAYAYKYDGPDGTICFFGIQFVSLSEPLHPQLLPSSVKLAMITRELRERYKGATMRVVDSRVIIAGYDPEMNKTYEMADTIIKTFQVTTDVNAKDATIESFVGNEFVADWSLAEARSVEESLSPHAVRPRMDVALTMKARIRNELTREIREFRDFDVDYQTLGVIGGYVEIGEKELVPVGNGATKMMYRPVFNITVCASAIPLEGVFGMLLAAFAPTIYSTKFWATQWSLLNKDSANPGMLEENPDDRGKPYILQNREDLLAFITEWFAEPLIAIQMQDGRDAIPGMFRMVSDQASDRAHLLARQAQFFLANNGVGDAVIARPFSTRYEGVFGDPNGVLSDSREVDYLYIAAHAGMSAIDGQKRRVLLTPSEPAERARVVQEITHSSKTLYLTTLAMINPEYIKWLVSLAEARNLTVIDPNKVQDARSLGSVTMDFGSSANMGSIITNGHSPRGLNLGSIWNRT